MKRSVKSTQREIRQLELKVVAGTISLSIDAAAIDATANTFTVAAGHGLVTGDRILATAVGTLPTGLTTATQYWIVKISATVFKLASTHANAVAATPTVINITDVGVDANTYAAVEKIAGPASQQASVQATAVGIYKITFDQNFVQVPVSIATPHARDQVLSAASLVGSVTISVDSLDETAALVDGFFDVLVIGSDVSDKY